MSVQQNHDVVEFFLAAVDLPEDQRRAYLDEVCGDDTELRIELDSLLRHHDPLPLIRDDAPVSMVDLLELPLRVVPEDRYEIRGEIARGGMGIVLRARDNEIGREVAIKVLPDPLAKSPDMLARFVAEAQIAGQLQHPGVAPLYEAGQFPDGRPFFAMELVGGQSFSSLLGRKNRRATDPGRLIGIFEQICQTVAYAHARGVIHRDLKPANVMVGEFGQVQVLDWGLAKVMSAAPQIDGDIDHMPRTVRSRDSDASTGSTTRLGTGMGTRGYASPEQARGDFDSVDRRSDVYSLGAILCEILTGDPAVPRSSTSNELSDSIESDPAGPFSRLDQCEADALLVELARQCLSPEPDTRPADAGVVAVRIDAYQQSVRLRLQQADLATAQAETKMAEERKRRVVTVALATTAVLLCAVAFGAWILVSSEQHRRGLADQRRERLVIQSINDALTDAVRLRELAKAAPNTSVQPWLRALEAAERADAMVADHGVDPELALKVSQTLASLKAETKNRKFFADIERARYQSDEALLHYYNTRANAGRFTEAFRGYGIEPVVMDPQDAAEIVRIQAGESLDELFTIANQWWLFDPRGRKTNETGKWVRQFVDVLDPDPWRRQWRDKIGRSHQNRDDMLPLLRDPATLERPVGDLVNLAQGLVRTRNPWIPEIIDFLEKAEKRYPRSVWIKFWLADFSARMQEPQLVQRGLRYSESLLLLRSTPNARVLHATLLRKAGYIDEAEVELQNLLESHPKNVAGLLEMVNVHIARSRWQQALESLEAANAAYRKLTKFPSFGKKSDIYVTMRARIYMKLGRYDEAVSIYQRLAVEMPRMAYQHYRNLGEAYLALERPDDAIDALRKAGQKNANTWQLLAEAYRAGGDSKSAIAALRSSITIQPQRPEPRFLLAELLAENRDWMGSVESYRSGFARQAEAGSGGIIRLVDAARVAVIAAADPSDQTQTNLKRDQLQFWARMWLRTAVDGTKSQERGPAELTGLLEDRDFFVVRDDAQLATLPVEDGAAWNRLWKDIEGITTQK